jgi:hypothetical protein
MHGNLSFQTAVNDLAAAASSPSGAAGCHKAEHIDPAVPAPLDFSQRQPFRKITAKLTTRLK